MYPYPPYICTASVVTLIARSAANALAKEDSFVFLFPSSSSHAPL